MTGAVDEDLEARKEERGLCGLRLMRFKVTSRGDVGESTCYGGYLLRRRHGQKWESCLPAVLFFIMAIVNCIFNPSDSLES